MPPRIGAVVSRGLLGSAMLASTTSAFVPVVQSHIAMLMKM